MQVTRTVKALLKQDCQTSLEKKAKPCLKKKKPAKKAKLLNKHEI